MFALTKCRRNEDVITSNLGLQLFIFIIYESVITIFIIIFKEYEGDMLYFLVLCDQQPQNQGY